jgi:hypothetical protein
MHRAGLPWLSQCLCQALLTACQEGLAFLTEDDNQFLKGDQR